jgi:hypothetical protein
MLLQMAEFDLLWAYLAYLLGLTDVSLVLSTNYKNIYFRYLLRSSLEDFSCIYPLRISISSRSGYFKAYLCSPLRGRLVFSDELQEGLLSYLRFCLSWLKIFFLLFSIFICYLKTKNSSSKGYIIKIISWIIRQSTCSFGVIVRICSFSSTRSRYMFRMPFSNKI